jgi:hypothetical protein
MKAASFGGIIAQEIIKAVSSKYTPINQWLFFDSLECLPKEGLKPEDVKLVCFFFILSLSLSLSHFIFPFVSN